MLVPALLSALRGLQPGLDVEVTHAEPDEALLLVGRGDADVAMAFAYPDDTPPAGIMMRTLFDDEVCAVLPVGDDRPGTGADPVPVTGSATPLDLPRLRRRPWIAGCPRPGAPNGG